MDLHGMADSETLFAALSPQHFNVYVIQNRHAGPLSVGLMSKYLWSLAWSLHQEPELWFLPNIIELKLEKPSKSNPLPIIEMRK